MLDLSVLMQQHAQIEVLAAFQMPSYLTSRLFWPRLNGHVVKDVTHAEECIGVCRDPQLIKYRLVEATNCSYGICQSHSTA